MRLRGRIYGAFNPVVIISHLIAGTISITKIGAMLLLVAGPQHACVGSAYVTAESEFFAERSKEMKNLRYYHNILIVFCPAVFPIPERKCTW